MDTSGIERVLAQLRETAGLAAPQGAPARAQPVKDSFGEVLKSSLDRVNGAQNKATGMAQAYELGEAGVELHEVMIAMQKANISFQAAVQVRNRLVSAYHDIMNMQV